MGFGPEIAGSMGNGLWGRAGLGAADLDSQSKTRLEN